MQITEENLYLTSLVPFKSGYVKTNTGESFTHDEAMTYLLDRQARHKASQGRSIKTKQLGDYNRDKWGLFPTGNARIRKHRNRLSYVAKLMELPEDRVNLLNEVYLLSSYQGLFPVSHRRADLRAKLGKDWHRTIGRLVKAGLMVPVKETEGLKLKQKQWLLHPDFITCRDVISRANAFKMYVRYDTGGVCNRMLEEMLATKERLENVTKLDVKKPAKKLVPFIEPRSPSEKVHVSRPSSTAMTFTAQPTPLKNNQIDQIIKKFIHCNNISENSYAIQK